MDKKQFDLLVKTSYGIDADFPWNSPEAVYRHKSNRKWFAIVLSVKKSKIIPEKENVRLGEEESIFKNQIKNKKKTALDEFIDIVNLKCPKEIMENIWADPNIYPAYHMNKNHWISVPLDGSVSQKTVEFLLEQSYNATSYKPKTSKIKST